MDELNLNKILDREHIFEKIKNILQDIEKTKSQDQTKKGFYIYGNPGSGKTEFTISRLVSCVSKSLFLSLIFACCSFPLSFLKNKLL